MGRKLPWKRAEQEPNVPTIKTESPLSRKRKSPSSLNTPPRPKRVAQVPHSALSNRARSPSTSPPPEPPREQFMTTRDDGFRIVEDEFLHVAQKFTVHLHRAEYQRLKKQAASHNAETIRAIERPVVGPPSAVTKQRAKVAQKTAFQRTVTHESNDAHLPTGLRGLMDSPRKEARSIRGLGRGCVATRAAAGFGSQGSPSRRADDVALGRPAIPRASTVAREQARSPSRRKSEAPARKSRAPSPDPESDIDTPDEEPEDNDLDSVPTSQRRESSSRRDVRERPMGTTSKSINRAKSAPNLKQRARPEPKETKTTIVSIKDEGDDDDDDDPFGVRKMRIRRAKSREEMRKLTAQETVDLIPSFL